MATTQVNRQVNIFIASGEAEKAYDRLIKKEQTLKTELEKATDPKVVARLKKELSALEEPLNRASKKAKGELKPNLQELENVMKRFNRELKLVDVGSKEFDQLNVKIRQTKIELGEAQARAAKLQNSLNNGNGFTRAASKLNNFTETNFGVGLGTTAVIAAGTAFLTKAYEESVEGERNLSRFKTTLENLGKIDSFKKFSDQADELQDRLKFFGSDDLYVIFDKLLSYGKLTEQEVSRLTPMIIDFAAKQQISFEEASDVIVKGLEGNGKALKLYGIDIKEASTTSERLGLIMNDLGNKVRGSAAAFGETTDGRIKKAQEEFNDVAGTVGDKLVPVLTAAIEVASFLITKVSDLASRVTDVFNQAFNRSKYFADQAAEQAKRLAEQSNRMSQALNGGEALSKLSNDELQKRLVMEEKLLALVTKRIETEFRTNQENETDRVLQQTSQSGIKMIRDEIASRQAIADRNKKEIEERDAAKNKAASEKEAAAAKQRADELSRLIAEIAAKTRELDLINLDVFTKAYAKMNDFYDKWLERAKGNAVVVKQVEELRIRESALLIDQYVQLVDDAEAKRRTRKAERDKAAEQKIEADRLARLLAFQETLAKAAAESADRQIGGRKYRNELDILTGNAKERLAARLDQLELERIAELNAAEKTGAGVLDIERKYVFLRAQLETNHLKDRINLVVGFVSQIASAYQSFADLQGQKDAAELEQDRIVNERKKDNYRRQLDGKILSQKEYDRKVAELDRQQEEKEKQGRIREFNRNKASQLLNATVNIAAQVAANLTPPWMAAIVAALGAIQLGVIASAQPPKFGQGGLLSGPLHAQGGMPVINPRTGRKEAEVEGGEVILSRATVRNNPDLVGQLLHTSMHRHGAAIPGWKNVTPSYMNLPQINKSINQVRLFENGGVFMPNSADGGSAINNLIYQKLAESVDMLSAQLSGGIRAYSVITDQEGQAQRLTDIRNDANMK